MRKRWVKALLAVGILAILVLLGFALMPRERLLLRDAHKLPLSVDAFDAGHNQYDTSAWRSNHEQLVLRNAPGLDYDTVGVRDVLTGSETPLQPFNDRFASQLKLVPVSIPQRGAAGSKAIIYTPSLRQFSPNGKWLLWKDKAVWRAFALDGSVQRQWPRDLQENRYRREVRWSSDSRLWLEPHYDNQFRINGARLHHMEASESDSKRDFAGSGGHWLLGITNTHHLLTHDYTFGSVSAYTLYDTDLETDHAPTRQINVRMPDGATFVGIYVAPDGTRLLWNLRIHREPPGPRPVQTFLGWFGIKAQEQNSLWVSNTDGSGLREIGYAPEKPVPAATSAASNPRALLQQRAAYFQRLYGVQWLADSKHALFFYGNDVYIGEVE